MPTTTEQEAQDRADMKQLVVGHDAALNRLMERHATAVFRFLVRMLGNEDDANDLAQEAFVRVYRARESYRPEKKFSTWLFTIAANLARNHLRWRARHPALSLDAPNDETGRSLGDGVPAAGADPRQATEAGERVAAVQSAVRSLPEDLREALVLCEWEGLTMAEAAEVLQTTAKAVDSRLYRARRKLRDQLEGWVRSG